MNHPSLVQGSACATSVPQAPMIMLPGWIYGNVLAGMRVGKSSRHLYAAPGAILAMLRSSFQRRLVGTSPNDFEEMKSDEGGW